ncbi:MAG TPA: hypothetical protein VHR86_09235, partial [Armatimonadota bacterium]|nr:hypothetical protein [Armatimonadota bacterium]
EQRRQQLSVSVCDLAPSRKGNIELSYTCADDIPGSISEMYKKSICTCKTKHNGEYASEEAIKVAKKELMPIVVEDRADLDGFIRHFRGQLLLLFRKRGLLTETQYRNGLKLL